MNTKKTKNINNQEKDFYTDENGYTVFTESFHLKRGYCCENSCRHCPFDFNINDEDEKSSIPFELRDRKKPPVSDAQIAEYYLQEKEYDDDVHCLE